MTMNPSKLHIAIIGGGMGGLTTAVALGKNPNIAVDIYEAAKDFAEFGAGLGIWCRGWKILEALGIKDDLARITPDALNDAPRLTYDFRKSDQSEGYELCDMITNGGLPTFHRAHLQQAILKHVPPSCRSHLSKRLVSYTQKDGKVFLSFADGSTGTCDLLIGADGVKSVVRDRTWKGDGLTNGNDLVNGKAHANGGSVPSEYLNVIWSGTVAYRALAPADAIRARDPNHPALRPKLTMYCGKYKHMLVYPIAQGNTINMVSYYSVPELEGTPFPGSWVIDLTNDDLLEVYAGWEREAQIIAECVQNPKQYAVHAVKHLESYVSGHVVLVGDAAHGMTPHQGSGAGQAIEDAYILATLLSDEACTRETLDLALKVYDSIRRPAATQVLEGSRRAGLLFDFCDDSITEENVKPMFTKLLNEMIDEQWKTAWSTTADEDKKRALDLFRQMVEGTSTGNS